MALKPVYKNTRGDAKKLANDARPGDHLYIVRDLADRYVLGRGGYDDPQIYVEYIVTKDRAFSFRADLMARPAVAGPGTGVISLSDLLGKEGAVYSKPPAGVRNMADQTRGASNAEVAQRAHQAHKDDMAKGNGASKILAAAGAKKKSWW